MHGNFADFLKLTEENAELAAELVELAARFDFEFTDQALSEEDLDAVSGGTAGGIPICQTPTGGGGMVPMPNTGGGGSSGYTLPPSSPTTGSSVSRSTGDEAGVGRGTASGSSR